jgi:hypothetical protein
LQFFICQKNKILIIFFFLGPKRTTKLECDKKSEQYVLSYPLTTRILVSVVQIPQLELLLLVPTYYSLVAEKRKWSPVHTQKRYNVE